jgi:hypothetical protein
VPARRLNPRFLHAVAQEKSTKVLARFGQRPCCRRARDPLAGGGARRTDPLIQLAGQDEFRPHQRGDALPRDNQGEKACCLTEECSHEVARCLIKDVPIAS